MVNNVADVIEEYILERLAETGVGKVELKRTELANQISCAPSQISYVLSTRFTHERGFFVESRRGLGGYIRITILDDTDIRSYIYEDMIKKVNVKTPFDYVRSMINYLLENRMVTKREAAMSVQFIMSLYASKTLDANERVSLIRNVFETLSKLR